MQEILLIISPIFFLILIGWFLRKKKIVKDTWIKVLNDFVYYIALPALIFLSFAPTVWTQELLKAITFQLTYLTALAVILFASLSLLPMRPKVKASFFVLVLLVNSVYMGFPIISSFTSRPLAEIAPLATFYLIFGLVASIFAIEYWVHKSGKIHTYADDFLKNPLLLSLIAGILASIFFKSTALEIVLTPLSMIAATASPLALFTLGAFMHGKYSNHHIPATTIAILLKLIIIPAITFVVSSSLQLGYEMQVTTTLTAAMPTAVTAFVLSEKYQLESKFIAIGIILTTLLSFATLAGWMLFL